MKKPNKKLIQLIELWKRLTKYQKNALIEYANELLKVDSKLFKTF